MATLLPLPLAALIVLLMGHGELAGEILTCFPVALGAFWLANCLARKGQAFSDRDFPTLAADVSLSRGVITITRRGESTSYLASECSWYLASPTQDTALGESLSFTMPMSRRVIIECPVWTGVLPFIRNRERVAVGWSDDSKAAWVDLLKRLQVPKGQAKSRLRSSCTPTPHNAAT